MPILIQKDVHSLTNTLLSYPYFVVKTFILSKTLYSHVIVFNFYMKSPLLLCPHLIKKSQFCQNYIILWIKKINRMPFIYDFLRKNYYSHAHFCQKNVHSLKNTLFSRPYFVRKTSIFSKTLCSPVNFFKIFMKNPLPSSL